MHTYLIIGKKSLCLFEVQGTEDKEEFKAPSLAAGLETHLQVVSGIEISLVNLNQILK